MPDFPLQPISAGRYEDRFERVDGKSDYYVEARVRRAMEWKAAHPEPPTP